MKHSPLRMAVGVAALTVLLLLPHTLTAQEANPVSEGARVYGNMCGRCHNPRSPLEQTDRN